MSFNRLRHNPSKTELIWLGSSCRLHHCSGTGMRVTNIDLRPVDCVRYLGLFIDSGITLARHVNHISGVCFFQLWPLRIIHRSLTADAAHALVRALIHTCINFWNGLLVSCPRYLTAKLQAVLRAAAKLVLQLPYRSSVSEVMHQQLHWLDVEDRLNYKIGLLVYKCFHGLAPGYLSDQCIPAPTFAGRANMRSSSRLNRQLYVPRNQKNDTGFRWVLLCLVCCVELAWVIKLSPGSQRSTGRLFHAEGEGVGESPRSNCRSLRSGHKQCTRGGRTKMCASDERADWCEVTD